MALWNRFIKEKASAPTADSASAIPLTREERQAFEEVFAEMGKKIQTAYTALDNTHKSLFDEYFRGGQPIKITFKVKQDQDIGKAQAALSALLFSGKAPDHIRKQEITYSITREEMEQWHKLAQRASDARPLPYGHEAMGIFETTRAWNFTPPAGLGEKNILEWKHPRLELKESLESDQREAIKSSLLACDRDTLLEAFDKAFKARVRGKKDGHIVSILEQAYFAIADKRRLRDEIFMPSDNTSQTSPSR
ncbi:MAG: hypothetical protein KGJ06_05340 [Pseudomonadota bacterium]|nr:hypothetical protein [Pseudomonadota bacterium]